MQRNPTIYIEAPARLHLGFLDLEGGLGRRFGSVGLTIEEVATKLSVSSSTSIEVIGDATGRVEKYAQKFISRKSLSNGCRIVLSERIPDHSGLGSGTQLALAVGTAISRINKLNCSAADIASTLNRGARSGIGIGAFQQGGFLVDAGRSTNTSIPPIISRIQFPSNWRAILVQDPKEQGIHGDEEYSSFAKLAPFPAETAAELCRLVMLQILPAICEQNIDLFNQGIYKLQACLGEYFAPVQGGRYTSSSVVEAISYLESQGVQGVGQSSWGPTGFAFVDSETQAHSLLRDLQNKFSSQTDLEFKVVSGRNTGALIKEKNLSEKEQQIKETEHNLKKQSIASRSNK